MTATPNTSSLTDHQTARRDPLECGDSSPLSRRRLVAVEVPHGSSPAGTPPLARATSAPLRADALLHPTATSRLEKVVTSHRTPNTTPPCLWLPPSVSIASLWSLVPAFLLLLLATLPLHAQEIFEEEQDSIPPAVERMYRKGLDYLVKTQTATGQWPDVYGSQPGVVGLAIVSMLAHGDDPNSGPYAQPIRRGLDFILKAMNPGNGYIGNSMYNHGFATLALAESYGAVTDTRLGPALQKAVALILTSQAQNPFGGWRYSPESADADTTVSGAQVVALLAARNAGLAIPDDAIRKALKFFTDCQTGDGGFGYTGPGGPNAPRTAIAVLAFALAKQKTANAFLAGTAFLAAAPPDQTYFHYYLYYAAQANFHTSPKVWRAWNAANIKTLTTSQTAEGAWTGNFGTTFSTTASLLSLALNFRFLPIYER